MPGLSLNYKKKVYSARIWPETSQRIQNISKNSLGQSEKTGLWQLPIVSTAFKSNQYKKN